MDEPRPHPWSDFRNFTFDLWRALSLPEPTALQFDIANFLQNGPRRRMIKAFRGVGKSWLSSAYVVWSLWRDPQKKVLVVSASKERADAFTIFCKRILDLMPELHHLRPRVGQRDSSIAFDVGPARPAQAPSLKSLGITSQLTGSRANIILADDCESPKNSLTLQQREKLAELVKEFDAVILPGGEIIYLGTDQTEQGLYAKLPERGYDVRVWPVRVPEKPEKYSGTLAPFVENMVARGIAAGTPTEPSRFDEQDLLEREASYGRSGFAMQFMLDPALSDAERYPLKLADLIVMDVDREVAPVRVTWASGPDQIINDVPHVGFTGDRIHRPMYVSPEHEPFTGSVMTIDPSGRGSDETGYAVTKVLRGMVYLRRCGGLKGGYDPDTLKQLAQIARAEGVKTIIVEDNYGGGMFTQLFRPVAAAIHPCLIEEVHHTGQKEVRIITTLEPAMNQHRIVVDATLLRNDQLTTEPKYQLFHQLTRVSRDRNALRHDDRLEAFAMGVAYWMEAMSRDVEKEEDRHREELWEQELAAFEAHVLGRPPEQPNYCDNF